ncbi:DNA alkylation repair protein [Anaerotruncus colihominis]|uniref:DNA alkylation repair protein n=1 Tax=Anaerotruncus colihominis TaxID=169435 RepID=A0A845SWX7_9FIRM|nr:DNA alkylation repair protein [Anaerotruncus colihominis]MCR2025311.1 DNA alkylation repair protein [Anaerotruncus colihominis]NDO40395.1 DNA alkylation repair protein [Anaerotruncus colihominis]
MKDIKRKGARTTKDISPEILEKLNHGEIETANIVEWFAIDRRQLLSIVLLQNKREIYLQPILEHVNQLKKQTSNTISEAIGEGLFLQADKHCDKECLKIIANHSSDSVRSWGCFMVGKNNSLSLSQMLKEIEAFARDSHFNVREEAWVAVRPSVISNLHESISILSEWALDENEYIRRFASEITRPRGVWCKHIEVLKTTPELALSILEPLKSDKSKYVRDSVANWLNDASKTQPEFVRNLCERWKEESNTEETRYIIKKALRTLRKSEEAV